MTPESQRDESSAVASAIRKELSYLEDNRYRWKMGGGDSPYQDYELQRHDERIAALRTEAQQLGIKL